MNPEEPKVWKVWCGMCANTLYEGDQLPCKGQGNMGDKCALLSDLSGAVQVPLSEKTKRDLGPIPQLIPLSPQGVEQLLQQGRPRR